MLSRTEESTQLAGFVRALWSFHQVVEGALVRQLGHRSLFRGAESYRQAGENLERTAEQCSKTIEYYRAQRRELGVGRGQSEGWAAAMQYAETLERLASAFAGLCHQAWRVRVLDELYDKESYRQDLRTVTDLDLEAGRARSDLLHYLDERGVIRAPVRIRWAVAFLGGILGGALGVVLAGLLGTPSGGFFPGDTAGCLVTCAVAGLGTFLGAIGGFKQELEWSADEDGRRTDRLDGGEGNHC